MNYPVALHLQGKTCIVVGGGRVAARKIAGLLQAAAAVVVISPSLDESLTGPLSRGDILWLPVRWQPGCLQRFRPVLVFAATDKGSTNEAIAAEARSLGALVNVVDAGASGDFSNMATLRRPPLLVTLDSAGAAPALVRWLRDRIAGCIREEHATLARWLGELRPQIREEIPEPESRRAFYRRVLDSEVLTLLGTDQDDEARSLLHNLMRKSE